MFQNNWFKKIITSFIILALLCLDVDVQAQPQPAQSVKSSDLSDQIQVSGVCGNVVSRYKGDQGSPVLILIEDVHCHFEVQQHITQILEELFKKYEKEGLDTIYVEGAQGALKLPRTASKVQKGWAIYALKHGKISGAEYYAMIVNPTCYVLGVENIDFYIRNLQCFRRSLELKSESKRLSLLDLWLEKRRTILSSSLKDFLMQTETFESGKISLSSYVDLLVQFLRRSDLKISFFPQLATLSKLQQYSKKISSKDISKVLEDRIQILLKQYSEQSKEYVSQTLRFRLEKITPLQYFSWIKRWFENSNITPPSELKRYVKFLKISKKFDSEKFYSELKEIQGKIQNAFCRTGQERQWLRIYEFRSFLKKLYALELTHADLHKWNQALLTFEILKQSFKEEKLKDLEFLYLASLELYHFYEWALRRDKVLIESTLSDVVSHRKSLGVLMVGGFHTEGITQQLREKKNSYVVIRPKMSDFQTSQNYFKNMRGDLDSFEKIFSSSFIYSNSTKQGNSLLKSSGASQALSVLSSLQDLTSLSKVAQEGGFAGALAGVLTESIVLKKKVRSLLECLLRLIEKPGVTNRINQRIVALGEPSSHKNGINIWRITGIEKIGPQLFISFTVNEIPYGIVLGEEAVLLNIDILEKGLKPQAQFIEERQRAKAKYGLQRDSSPKVVTHTNGEEPNGWHIGVSGKEDLMRMLQDSFTAEEAREFPEMRDLLKIVGAHGISAKIWNRCWKRARFLIWETKYNNDKFASYIWAGLVAIAFFIVYLLHAKDTSVLLFAGVFWVLSKVGIVHFGFFVGGLFSYSRSRSSVYEFHQRMKIELAKFVEGYQKRKENVISSLQTTSFTRPLKNFLKELLMRFWKDLPGYDGKVGRKNETFLFILKLLFPKEDFKGKNFQDLIEMGRRRIEQDPIKVFNLLLSHGITLGVMETVSKAVSGDEIPELDRKVYYAYLDRLPFLYTAINKKYREARTNFQPLELFAKLRQIFSNRNIDAEDALKFVAFFFYVCPNPTVEEEKMIGFWVRSQMSGQSLENIQGSIKPILEEWARTKVILPKTIDQYEQQWQRRLAKIFEPRQADDAMPLSQVEKDMILLSWAEQIVKRMENPAVMDLVHHYFDDIPDAAWIGSNRFAMIVEGKDVTGFRHLLAKENESRQFMGVRFEDALREKRWEDAGSCLAEMRNHFGEDENLKALEYRMEFWKAAQALNLEINVLISVGKQNEALTLINDFLEEWESKGVTELGTALNHLKIYRDSLLDKISITFLDELSRRQQSLSPQAIQLAKQITRGELTNVPLSLLELSGILEILKRQNWRQVRKQFRLKDAPGMFAVYDELRKLVEGDSDLGAVIVWMSDILPLQLAQKLIQAEKCANNLQKEWKSQDLDLCLQLWSKILKQMQKYGIVFVLNDETVLDLKDVKARVEMYEYLKEYKKALDAGQTETARRALQETKIQAEKSNLEGAEKAWIDSLEQSLPKETTSITSTPHSSWFSDHRPLTLGTTAAVFSLVVAAHLSGVTRSNPSANSSTSLSTVTDLPRVPLPGTPLASDTGTGMDSGSQTNAERDAAVDVVRQDVVTQPTVTTFDRRGVVPGRRTRTISDPTPTVSGSAPPQRRHRDPVRTYFKSGDSQGGKVERETSSRSRLKDYWSSLQRRFLNPVFLSIALALGVFSGPLLAQPMAPPVPASATVTRNPIQDRIQGGYHLVLREPVQSNEVLVIETSSGSDFLPPFSARYYLRSGTADVWLTQSQGHTSLRMAAVAQTPSAFPTIPTRVWRGPFTIALNVPARPNAPLGLGFDADSRNLTWDAVTEARLYRVSGYDPSIQDQTETSADERWISLGDIPQSQNPHIQVTRSGLTLVRVEAVVGEVGGEVMGAAIQCALPSRRLPTPPSQELNFSLGYVVRNLTSYVLVIEGAFAGATEYEVYTSNSREALEALSRFLTTHDDREKTQARELGYQEYKHVSARADLPNSYGHRYLMIRRIDGPTPGRISPIETIGSSYLPETDINLRLAGGINVVNPTLADWRHADVGGNLRDAAMTLFLPSALSIEGRPVNLNVAYRTFPFFAANRIQDMFLASFILGTHFVYNNSFVGVRPNLTLTPSFGILYTPMSTPAIYGRLGYGVGINPRSSHFSMDARLSGEGSLVYYPDLENVEFDTRARTLLPGTNVPQNRWRDMNVYSRVLVVPALALVYRISDTGFRVSATGQLVTEFASPRAITAWAGLRMEVPNWFFVSGEYGYGWDRSLPATDGRPAEETPFLRVGMMWAPGAGLRFEANELYRWAGNPRSESTLNIRGFWQGRNLRLGAQYDYTVNRYGMPFAWDLIFSIEMVAGFPPRVVNSDTQQPQGHQKSSGELKPSDVLPVLKDLQPARLSPHTHSLIESAA